MPTKGRRGRTCHLQRQSRDATLEEKERIIEVSRTRTKARRSISAKRLTQTGVHPVVSPFLEQLDLASSSFLGRRAE